jgi:hypothetical protein
MLRGPRTGKANASDCSGPAGPALCPRAGGYSTVTDFARLRGLSTSQPRSTAM